MYSLRLIDKAKFLGRLLIILTLLFAKQAKAQTDTLFWFAAPEVTSGHSDSPIAIRLSAYDKDAEVKITQPANSSFAPIEVSVNANSLYSVDLTTRKGFVEAARTDDVTHKGLLIESTTPITAYYEVISVGNNPDIFSLKGNNALGKYFVIPSQNVMDNGNYSPQPYSSFEIVATEDNTLVTITPANNIVGRPKGLSYTKLLHKGDTYSAIAESKKKDKHLGGTLVSSNKNIAITIKDDSVFPPGEGCRDLLGDQLIPVKYIGDEYIVVRGPTGEDDYVMVCATENNTDIYLNGQAVPKANIDLGDAYAITGIKENSVYIKTSKPVYVLHISGLSCEYGMAVVPQLICSGSMEVSFVRTVSTFFSVMLMTKNGAQGSFTINGNPNLIKASDFSAVPGTNGEYVAALIDMTNLIASGSRSLISNSKNAFHLGIFNGKSHSGCRYGYFSDFGRLQCKIEGPETICKDKEFELKALPDDEDYTYLWSTGEITPKITINEPGEYWVLIDNGICPGRDTVVVSINESLNFLVKADPLCIGSISTLRVIKEFESYLWSTGETTRSIDVSEPGTYEVAVTDKYGCEWTKEIKVKEIDAIDVEILGEDICHGKEGLLSTVGSFYKYEWSTGSTDSEIIITEPGKYYVSVESSNGCTGSDTIDIKEMPPFDVFMMGDTICKGEETVIQPNGVYYSYLWSTGETSAKITIDEPGTYSVLVENEYGCEGVGEITIASYPPSGMKIIGDSAICYNEIGKLSANKDFPAYYWSTGDRRKSIEVSSPGIYSLKIYDENGCLSYDTIEVKNAAPEAEITGEINICDGAAAVLESKNEAWRYLWSTGETEKTIEINKPGKYYLITSSESGCADTAYFDVGEYPRPELEIIGDTKLCRGEKTELRANKKFNNYLWSTGDDTWVIETEEAGEYFLIVENEYGCKDTAWATVEYYDNPEVVIIGDLDFCEGDSAILASKNVHEKYLWSTGDTTNQITVNKPGEYSLIAGNDYGCIDSSKIIIAIHSLPSPTIIGDTSFCPGESVVLSADSEYPSYQWSNGQSQKSIEVSEPGEYTLIVENEYGCEGECSIILSYIEASVEIDSSLVDFGYVLIDSTKKLQRKIVNTGKEDIEILVKMNNSREFSLGMDEYTAYIEPGKEHVLDIYFTPENIYDYTDTIRVNITAPCPEEYIIPVSGSGLVKMIASLPLIGAEVGLRACIPIRAKLLSDRDISSTADYYAEIEFDGDMLESEMGCAPNGDKRIIAFSGRDVYADSAEFILDEFCGLTLIGDKDLGPLNFLEFTWDDPHVLTDTVNGTFHVGGLCQRPISRIQRFEKTTMSILPNPAADNIHINVKSEETGYFCLRIFSANGEQLEELQWSNEDKLNMEINLTTEKYLQGLYNISLITPWNSYSRKLIIIK